MIDAPVATKRLEQVRLQRILNRKEGVVTQPNKRGRTLKTARAIARRKLKERQKRQNAAKYAARTGRTR